MKYLIPLLLLLACKNTTTVTQPQDSLLSTDINNLMLNTSYDVQKLRGLYSGSFDGSPISFSINYISGKNVSGYNIHKGLKRNVRGVIQPSGNSFLFTLNEPGDNKFDGSFAFSIDTTNFKGNGTWVAKNDAKLGTKKFTLAKSKINEANQILNSWADTLSNTIIINEDGQAEYQYYENDKTLKAQLQTFTGSWQQVKDTLLIFWQPNSVFPDRKSKFTLQYEKYDDDTTKYLRRLKGAGKDWYMNEY
jgi:hypothetical protein